MENPENYMRTNTVWTEEEVDLLKKLYVEQKLQVKEVCVYFPNRTYQSIRSRIKLEGIGKFKSAPSKYKGVEILSDIDINELFPINTPLNAYVYGLLATDGCIMDKRVSINSIDKEVCDSTLSALKVGTVFLKKEAEGNNNAVYQWEYRRVRINRSFEKIGLPSNKTFVLDWNTLISNVPENLMNHFIRGLWDGDGCIYFGQDTGKNSKYMKMSMNFITASKEMAEGFHKFLNQMLGSNVSLRIIKGKYYTFAYSSDMSKRLCEYMYRDSDGIRIERKYNKYLEFLRYRKYI